ncbi:hypothetical protein H6M51_20790 [Rhizobium sp. AQ_MP]|uniref:DUF6152 family protein n=1 Tax=Rhizobium sp. AQ_MP TaxID=2761536 RepID=UPI001639A658|nr:DUF6152 family protein [Rhizobium sp. AQ_MP]MBC2775301.1 hypothetical protein [Rhizobium sp. AQ_MP]
MNRSLSLSILAGVVLSAGTAMAHHGWSWAEADQIDLTGKITAISFAPPHPTLELDTAEGPWRIELGNPNQTQRSGFVEGVVAVGDEVTVRGNRSLDPDEKRLKAVRVIVEGRNYDIYPSRIVTN